MENNFQSINCLNDSGFPRYREELGSYGSIDVEKSRWNTTCTSHMMQWRAWYTIDSSKCIVIRINSFVEKDTIVKHASLDFVVETLGSIFVRVGKDNGFLGCPKGAPIYIGLRKCRQKNKTITASGYVVETHSYLYKMNECKGGLVVVEEKRKSGDAKKPCKVTVAHYFTAGSGNMFSQNEIDIGLSVIVTIQPSSKVGLDITVEGPTKHHTGALHYMFEEVMETGIWKPTICSHCAKIERLHSDMLRQVTSEYNANLQPPNGRIPNKVILVDNSGLIIGDNNGNILIQGNLYILHIWDNFLETSQAIIRICNIMGVKEIEIKKRLM